MSTLKITKKHHKHLNNPFPSTPKSLSLIHGSLSFNPHSLPSHHVYSIGSHFQALWSSINGGYFSISHLSQPKRSIWATLPGQAFVSAAMVETEVEESRGSFAIKDRKIHLICNHQSIEDIRVINDSTLDLEANNQDLPSGYIGLELKQTLKDAKSKSPVFLITGYVFNIKRNRKEAKKSSGVQERLFLDSGSPSSCSAKYWVLFYQKNNHQIGFKLKLGKPNYELHHPKPKASNQRLGRIRIRRFGLCWFPSRPKGLENQFLKSLEFNRICMTYSSDRDERFYGFGEQFSHMDFKGKRVPIFVQEQGIGRGDQPITLAINMVSYRAGGDWSTTYAPSPFYMTSKMRSLYLEGYNYTIFDLTREDRVQIQEYGNSVEGTILHGNSPTELIENFTGSIGRPPELPHWIISGAVVGMQGGTEAVRDTWDTLKTYDVPISSYWLQVLSNIYSTSTLPQCLLRGGFRQCRVRGSDVRSLTPIIRSQRYCFL